MNVLSCGYHLAVCHCGQDSSGLKIHGQASRPFSCAYNRALTGAESGLNGCKESVSFTLLLYFLLLFFYFNVCKYIIFV